MYNLVVLDRDEGDGFRIAMKTVMETAEVKM